MKETPTSLQESKYLHSLNLFSKDSAIHSRPIIFLFITRESPLIAVLRWFCSADGWMDAMMTNLYSDRHWNFCLFCLL